MEIDIVDEISWSRDSEYVVIVEFARKRLRNIARDNIQEKRNWHYQNI